jgi:IS5 family transposase
MKILSDLQLRFENGLWALDPELALIDTVLEGHPEFYDLVAEEIVSANRNNNLGRGDAPSVEQVVRGAIFKELKQLSYRELEYAQYDSRICPVFIKLGTREPFSFEVFYKYISRISGASLTKLMVAINKVALEEGLEDAARIRLDTTVVESDIHYPTNNSLVWDCIRESQRLLSKLEAVEKDADAAVTCRVRDYTAEAKRNYFKINVSKSAEKRQPLFEKQLKILRRSIKQTERVLGKPSKEQAAKKQETAKLRERLEELLPKMEKVYSMTKRRELDGQVVPNEEKIFSIYEEHTDIIVKGTREVQFGHKVNLSTGKSGLILGCEILEGNPADSTLYQPAIEDLKNTYDIRIRDVVTDGGFASLKNLTFAQDDGMINIVFNKVVGSLRNITTSLSMETRLKKWRSGIEAVISNLKRGFDLFRSEWKSKKRFDAKVMWSVIAYNIRTMTRLCLARLSALPQ